MVSVDVRVGRQVADIDRRHAVGEVVLRDAPRADGRPVELHGNVRREAQGHQRDPRAHRSRCCTEAREERGADGQGETERHGSFPRRPHGQAVLVPQKFAPIGVPPLTCAASPPPRPVNAPMGRAGARYIQPKPVLMRAVLPVTVQPPSSEIPVAFWLVVLCSMVQPPLQ